MSNQSISAACPRHEVKQALQTKFGEVTHVHLHHRLKFGFARFKTREGADAAIQAGKVHVLDQEVEICSACEAGKGWPEKQPLTEDERDDSEDDGSQAASDAAENPAKSQPEDRPPDQRGWESDSEASMAEAESWAHEDVPESEAEDDDFAERERVLGTLEAIRASTTEVLRKANSKIAMSELESRSDIAQLKEAAAKL
ncbi:unnamed protein product [Symbiodinium natans]|uniref:RRM domain-containing protein n=1 Tax=Symbiodinium natans TaxID=878477 RepID=A0A812JCS2_9DINO|nr:unnamed protein product [Symbiodinium natans]